LAEAPRPSVLEDRPGRRTSDSASKNTPLRSVRLPSELQVCRLRPGRLPFRCRLTQTRSEANGLEGVRFHTAALVFPTRAFNQILQLLAGVFAQTSSPRTPVSESIAACSLSSITQSLAWPPRRPCVPAPGARSAASSCNRNGRATRAPCLGRRRPSRAWTRRCGVSRATESA